MWYLEVQNYEACIGGRDVITEMDEIWSEWESAIDEETVELQ